MFIVRGALLARVRSRVNAVRQLYRQSLDLVRSAKERRGLQLMLEFGDRVGVLMPPDRKEEIRRHFGDTVKAAAEFSYVSLGLGMVMGVLLGLIPIPIPGVGIVTLGIGGGPLIVALILGKLRRTGPMQGRRCLRLRVSTFHRSAVR